MAFFDKLTDIASKIGDKATDIAQNIGDKTSDAIEIGKLNSRIGAERNEEAKLVKQLGELIYGRFRNGDMNGLDEEIFMICRQADEHAKTTEELQAQIDAIKAAAGAQKTAAQDEGTAEESASAVCAECGRPLPDGAKFCAGCGARVEEREPDSGEKQ